MDGNIWLSTDSGQSWTEKFPAGKPDLKWQGIASSSDGAKIAATVIFGDVWTSADAGQSWSPPCCL